MSSDLEQQRNVKVKELEGIASFMQDKQQEMQTLAANRQTLISQYNENQLTKEELEQVPEGGVVYKLIGPALVKQDRSEALDTVTKRLEFIKGSIERAEKDMQAKQQQVDTKKARAMSLQQELQQLQQQMQQLQIGR